MVEAPAPILTLLEQSVVALAIKDADAGFAGPLHREASLRAKLSMMYCKVAGVRGHTPLANPRLEMLRRFASATHRLRRPADTLIPELIAQGFDEEAITAVNRLAV